VFPSRKKIIFVHGCFWHQHNSKSCRIVRFPKSNLVYWKEKLRRNVDRDKAIQKNLRAFGWRVLVIWECSLRNETTITKRLRKFLESPSSRPAISPSGFAFPTTSGKWPWRLRRFGIEVEE
jgi:DNA mismatch endonuclease (patch repair protein)